MYPSSYSIRVESDGLEGSAAQPRCTPNHHSLPVLRQHYTPEWPRPRALLVLRSSFRRRSDRSGLQLSFNRDRSATLRRRVDAVENLHDADPVVRRHDWLGLTLDRVEEVANRLGVG